MRQLKCFAIIPSNRNGESVKLLDDDRWGVVETPSGCKGPVGNQNELILNFDDVYEQIVQNAITDVNNKYINEDIHITCIRGQDLAEAGDILGQLLRNICTADITVTDITTNNPNVFLEYGIRLAVKDEANIMICHKRSKRPFDVEKLRCIEYSMDIKGANQAKDKIAEFIATEVENNFLEEHRAKIANVADFEPGIYSLFKQLVDLHTGRQHERELVNVLKKAPWLLADFASFLFTNKKSPGLKQELFKVFDDVEEVLKNDPGGHTQAIKHLEMIEKIRGLSQERLQDTYYKLWELCDTDPNLKNKAQYYLDKFTKLED